MIEARLDHCQEFFQGEEGVSLLAEAFNPSVRGVVIDEYDNVVVLRVRQGGKLL